MTGPVLFLMAALWQADPATAQAPPPGRTAEAAPCTACDARNQARAARRTALAAPPAACTPATPGATCAPQPEGQPHD